MYALVDKIPVSGAGSLGLPYEKTDASDAYTTLSSSITTTADSIKLEVSETYETKDDADDAYDDLTFKISIYPY